MTTTLRRTAPAVASAALVALLAGCGSPSPAPTSAPPSSPSPDATVAVVEPGSAPLPRTQAQCADLLDPAVASAAFGAPVELAGPERTAQYIALIAPEWKVLQAGGVTCEWMTSDSIVASEGLFGYQGVRVFLLPVTEAYWEPFSLAEAGGTTRHVACNESSCALDQFHPAGWWLHASANDTARGFADPATATAALFDALSASVAALPAPTSPWSAPSPSVTLAASCEALVTGEQVAEAVGIPGPATAEAPYYPSIASAADNLLGTETCRWLAADAFTPLLQIAWLPGGAWAMHGYLEAAEAMSGTAVATVAVPGVDAPGWYAQHVDFESLSVEIGGNWVVLTAGHDGVGSRPTADALVAVAARIAATAG